MNNCNYARRVWTTIYKCAGNRLMNFTRHNGSPVVSRKLRLPGMKIHEESDQKRNSHRHERYLYRSCLQMAVLNMPDNRNALRMLLWDSLEPVATRPLVLVQDNVLYCYGMDFTKNVMEVFGGEASTAEIYDYSPYGQVASTENLVQPVQWSSEMNGMELVLTYSITVITIPQTADGSTGIPPPKKGDGILMGMPSTGRTGKGSGSFTGCNGCRGRHLSSGRVDLFSCLFLAVC